MGSRAGFLAYGSRHYTWDEWKNTGPMNERQYNAALADPGFRKSHSNMPTFLEMRGLHCARMMAKREFERDGLGCAQVNLSKHWQGKSAFFAQVSVSQTGASSAILEESEQADIGSFIWRKQWVGVPEWPTRKETTTMKRIPGGRLDIHAPAPQGHVIYEDLHVFHQPRVHHHQRPVEHVQHGQPQNIAIGYDPRQVQVHQPSQPIIQHHQPRQSLLSALFGGVKSQPAPQVPHYAPPPQQPQYQALPAPQPEYRGELHALPAPQQQRQAAPAPMMLPAPSQQSMPTLAALQTKKKSWSW